jgi:hypothetical protein
MVDLKGQYEKIKMKSTGGYQLRRFDRLYHGRRSNRFKKI